MTDALYDAAGNMTKDPTGTTPQHTYSYDADGNLTAVDGGSTGAYAYDSLNRRVRAQTAGGSAEFVFDQYGRRVSTWNGSTHASTEANIYSDSGPVAIRTGGSTHFEHQNWVGTERLRTAYNGAVETQFTSLPWGDGSSTTGTDSDPYDFAGLDRDQEDQSEHAQFRNYSPAQARWLSPDPFYGSYSFTNPQSFNRYSYALNNPVNFIDPSGLDGGGVTCTGTEGGWECPSDGDDGGDSGTSGTGGDDGSSGSGSMGGESGSSGYGASDGCATGCWGQDGIVYTTVFVYGTWDAPPGYVPMQNGSGGWYLPLTFNFYYPVGGPNASGGSSAPSNGNQKIANQISTVDNCTSQANAAMNAGPSVSPTAQNIIDGIVAATYTVATDGTATVLSVLKSFFKGAAVRSAGHAVQDGLTFLTTYHGCLAAAGQGSPYNPYSPN